MPTLRKRVPLSVTCHQCKQKIPGIARGVHGVIEPRDEYCTFCDASTLACIDYETEEAFCIGRTISLSEEELIDEEEGQVSDTESSDSEFDPYAPTQLKRAETTWESEE